MRTIFTVLIAACCGLWSVSGQSDLITGSTLPGSIQGNANQSSVELIFSQEKVEGLMNGAPVLLERKGDHMTGYLNRSPVDLKITENGQIIGGADSSPLELRISDNTIDGGASSSQISLYWDGTSITGYANQFPVSLQVTSWGITGFANGTDVDLYLSGSRYENGFQFSLFEVIWIVFKNYF